MKITSTLLTSLLVRNLFKIRSHVPLLCLQIFMALHHGVALHTGLRLELHDVNPEMSANITVANEN